METSELVEVTIDSVRSIRSQPENESEHRVVVLRSKGDDRILPIWVGIWEANAITIALEGQQTDRPMTHDLALRLLDTLGAQVQRVVVNKLLENTFFAEITLARGDQIFQVDARPSDALALAARIGAPIYAAGEVVDTAGGPESDDLWRRLEARAREWRERHAQGMEAAGERQPAAE